MIGKATVAVVALIVLLGIVAVRIPDELGMLLIVGAGILTVFGYLFFLEFFVRKHPDIAATEGLTYVQSRQIALAAKGIPKIPYEDLVPDPQNPTLLSINTKPAENDSGG